MCVRLSTHVTYVARRTVTVATVSPQTITGSEVKSVKLLTVTAHQHRRRILPTGNRTAHSVPFGQIEITRRPAWPLRIGGSIRPQTYTTAALKKAGDADCRANPKLLSE